MKRVVVVIALLFLAQLSFGQNKKYFIEWDEARPLVWEDFKGRAEGSSVNHATTYGVLGYKYESISGNKNKFILELYFDMKKSWVKKGKETDNLLVHEQAHFDIFEIYGRILMKRLIESEALKDEKYSNNVIKVFKKAYKEMTSLQKEYDRETNHSKNEVKQTEWIEKLKNMLTEYKEYTQREIVFEI